MWHYWILLFLLLLICPNFAVSKTSQTVEYLPGFVGTLPFKLETGYVGVGEEEESQLFYYFIESESSPEDDPLVLWLTGGPQCSSFAGLVVEVGPIMFDIGNPDWLSPKLVSNPYSWTKIASMIFLDAPVGTGFSYSETRNYKTSDTLSAHQTYTFLKKWLIDHPKFLKNPLYICGDSYSGVVIPIIVEKILKGIEMGHEPQMRLKGYTLGNPVTDKNIETNSRVEFAKRVSLISDEIYESAKRSCKGEFASVDPTNVECLKDLQLISKCVDDISSDFILDPKCPDFVWNFNVEKKRDRSLLLRQDPSPIFLLPRSQIPLNQCRYFNFVSAYPWANSKIVREALHIREGTKEKWVGCNKTKTYVKDSDPSVVHYHRSFTNTTLRVLIYSGDHDYGVPTISTEAWIKSLDLPVHMDWHPWYVDGQIAGYTMMYASCKNNTYCLTFATVKGAGHTAPEYKRKECLAMARRWFSDQLL